MRKLFVRIGTLMALAAVVLGAFGSHGLKDLIEAEQLEIFDTGVRYQFYHALALLVVGILLKLKKKRQLILAGYAFTAGIVLFSGSLYLLSIRETFGLPLAWLGPVTPVGGVLFIAGWGLFFFSTYESGTYTIEDRKEGSM